MIQENQYALVLLTMSYLVGEMGHFLLSSTSRDISRDIGYGDKACFNVINMTDSCGSIKNREGCEASKCSWEYTGLGLDYQVYFPIDSFLNVEIRLSLLLAPSVLSGGWNNSA